MTKSLPLATVVTTLRADKTAYASMTYSENKVIYTVTAIRQRGRLYELTVAGQRKLVLRGGAFPLTVTSRPAVALSASIRR